MFRPATEHDTTLLYRWRRQQETQGTAENRYQGNHTTPEEHMLWLMARLGNPLVDILIWEPEPFKPTGSVRIDSDGMLTTQNGDPDMARTAAKQHAKKRGGRLKSLVDETDVDRRTMLEQAGFREYPAAFYCWRP